MANILVVDDDREFNEALTRFLEKKTGHGVKSTLSLDDALRMAGREAFDLVFLDVKMNGRNGLEYLPRFKEAPSRPEVIVLTGYADSVGAKTAIESGAWDYVKKPFSRVDALSALDQALQYREDRLRSISGNALKLAGIAGSGPAMRQCFDKLAQFCSWECSVLISGETGTGKELFARAIHENSRRAGKPFVVVDCTVLPENLVESWLFGYKKGAFTGADIPRKGLIKEAHGGTLFLDEVGELPLSLQRKFLRVLETRMYKPVGGGKEVESDFRLVTATNKDLESMVREGSFRKDLLYRIKGSFLYLPPLSQRREDIPSIVDYHLKKTSEEKGTKPLEATPEFLECLRNHQWAGNVRELVNVLESAASEAGESGKLYQFHLPAKLRIERALKSIGEGAPSDASRDDEPANAKPLPNFKEYRKTKTAEIEKDYLRKLMDAGQDDISKAMEISGISRSRLYKLLGEHGISRKGGSGKNAEKPGQSEIERKEEKRGRNE